MSQHERYLGPRLRAGLIAAAVAPHASPGPAAVPAQAPAIHGSPAPRSGPDSAATMAFVDSLRAAVGRDDRRAVAALIAYPARIWDGQHARRVENARAFMRLYPRVVTPELQRDLAAVRPDSLFANWQGVMFTSGRVWFRRTGRDGAGPYRVVTINRPVASH